MLGLLLTTLGCAGRTEHETDLVIFVVIDTLRRDHLGIYGYERETSPFLDELAPRSLFLRHMVAHASQTVPSMASIFTSTLPSEHQIQFYPDTMDFGTAANAPVLRSDLTTMAERFQAAGYETAGFVTNPWLRRELGFAQGFDVTADDAVRD